MKTATGSLRPLTAFRFLAALAVFLFHLTLFMPIHLSGFSAGFSGVTFFFVLSGFILTYNYRDSFRQFGWGQFGSFFAARVARIYPVHLLTFFAALFVAYRFPFSQPFRVLARLFREPTTYANLSCTHSFMPNIRDYLSFNAPSWSLSDEFFFYALLPMSIWLFAKSRLERALPAALLAAGVWGAGLLFTWSMRTHANWHWWCYINPLFRLVDFSIGVLLCQVFFALRRSSWALTGKTSATVLELATLLGLAIAVVGAARFPASVQMGSYYTPVMCCVILIFAFQRGYVSDLLSTRVFQWLGEISFSFYMIHLLVLQFSSIRFGISNQRAMPVTFIVLNSFLFFTISIVLSGLCYRYYEIPMRNWVKRMLLRESKDRLTSVKPNVQEPECIARAA